MKKEPGKQVANLLARLQRGFEAQEGFCDKQTLPFVNNYCKLVDKGGVEPTDRSYRHPIRTK
jgi:hypothetical protein